MSDAVCSISDWILCSLYHRIKLHDPRLKDAFEVEAASFVSSVEAAENPI